MYVYALSSKVAKYIYVGLTHDIDSRFERHNTGKIKTTKTYLPYQHIFLTSVESLKEARDLEKYFKSGTGKEFLKSLRDNAEVAKW